jgi:lipid-binding SYLF domain-containing protein
MWMVSFAVILLDYASQAAINPCESLVADILKSASNANTGFMIYSAMLSLGSCVGYLLSGRSGSGPIFAGSDRAWVGLWLHTLGSGFCGLKNLLNKVGLSRSRALLNK